MASQVKIKGINLMGSEYLCLLRDCFLVVSIKMVSSVDLEELSSLEEKFIRVFLRVASFMGKEFTYLRKMS